MRRRHHRSVLLAASVALAMAACSDDGATVDDAPATPTVMATTSILGDIVQQVLGECATVEVLLPPGADPHDVELSARQAAGLREADVVFAWGLGLEESLEDALDAAADDGVEVVEVSESVEPIPFGESDDHQDEEEPDGHQAEEDAHGEYDPHVWQDPSRMVDVVDTVRRSILVAETCDAAAIETAAAAYTDALVELDAEVDARYSTIPDDRRILVTNHDAFGYLADRYDFEIVGTVIPSGTTLAEPSAADLAALVEVIEREQVPAIFGETTSSADLVDTLADEVGTPVAIVDLYSDALGPPGSEAEDYRGLVRTNADRITDALTS